MADVIRALWRRFVCWLRGHDWRCLRAIDRVAIWMGHLHPLIGMDADCDRCGKQWRDFETFNRYPWTDEADRRERSHE